MIKSSKNGSWLSGAALSVFIAAALLFGALFSVRTASAAVDGQTLAYARDTVTRAAALCYAVEGASPQELAYLEENYGLALDRARFTYHYEPLGGNLFPEIYVVAKPAG